MADFPLTDFSSLQNLQGLLSFEPNADEQQKALRYGLIGAGLGILSANATTPRGAGPGYAIGAGGLPGFQAYTSTLESAPKQRLQNVQSMLQIAGLKKTLDSQDLLKGFAQQYMPGGQQSFQAGQQALAAEQSAGGDAGPTIAAAQRIPQTPAARQVPPFANLLAGGVDPKIVSGMMEDYKLRQPQMKVDNGYAYDANSINPGFLPQVHIARNGQATIGIPNAQGSIDISAPPGALNTYGQYVNAEQQAQARYQLQTRPPLGPKQPPTYLSTLDALGLGQPSPAQQTPAPMQQPASPQPPITMSAPNAQAGRALAGQLDAQGQPFTVNVPPPIPSRNVVPSIPAPNAAGMSPVEAADVKSIEAANTEQGQLNAKTVDAFRQKIPSVQNTLRRLDRLQQLTANDQTYAAAGADVKTQLGSIAQAFGLNVNKDKTANTEEYTAHIAELLKERLGSKDYGSGTGVSNLDLAMAGRPLPEVAKTAQGRQQIINALRVDTQRSLMDMNAAVGHFDKNMTLRGFQFPSTSQPLQYGDGQQGAAPSPGAAPRARNPKTGQEAEFRNGQWQIIDRRKGASGAF